MRTVCIIPARKGSKRIPNKNKLNFAGAPLISHSINQAIKSDCFDEIHVNTDDLEIAELAQDLGCKVPFIRPDELASDTATTYEVVAHHLHMINMVVGQFTLLQATAPLRRPENIIEATNLFVSKQPKAVVSVSRVAHSPDWNLLLSDNGTMEYLNKLDTTIRSQDQKEYYRLNGSIYIYDIASFLKAKKFFYNEFTSAYIMSEIQSVDIDTINDFKIAEYIFKELTF